MSAEVKIPAVGESITSGLLSTWHKEDGETVAAGDVLLTLETDKVSTELTAESAGQPAINQLRAPAVKAQAYAIEQVALKYDAALQARR